MKPINIILWIVVAAIFTTFPVIFIKKYISTKMSYWLILAILSMCVTIFALYNLFVGRANTSVVFAIVKSTAMILISIISVIYFNDELPPRSLFGIFLILIAIILLASDIKTE